MTNPAAYGVLWGKPGEVAFGGPAECLKQISPRRDSDSFKNCFQLPMTVVLGKRDDIR
ncbi:MAG: hypothetical protein O3A29_19785 [Planctomycetota bacterium]|nr:hypothetical protein [Planctomycetota bacterium]